jgi:hypothetical protein
LAKPRMLILVASLALAGACSKSPQSLLGPLDELTAIEGQLFTPSTSFRAGSAEAQSVARILLRGRSCEDLKAQGAAAFALIRKDGRKISVDVTKPGSVVRVDGTAFSVDMPALMSLLKSLAR